MKRELLVLVAVVRFQLQLDLGTVDMVVMLPLLLEVRHAPVLVVVVFFFSQVVASKVVLFRLLLVPALPVVAFVFQLGNHNQFLVVSASVVGPALLVDRFTL